MKTNSSIDSENNTISSKTILNGVFAWMGVGLFITSLISYLVYSIPSLLALLINENGVTGLGYIIMFSPIIFVLIMSFGFNRLSYFALAILFLIYSAIMGASLSFIFLVYTQESIYTTFFSTASMFGLMAIMGYTTKTDLTKMGSILLMGLMGIIIASLINLFMRNDSLSFFISCISVVIFCGLTAFDIQKLKNLEADTISDSESKSKFGIFGALTLYLDFINLFLSLLRIFGKRKNS
jgi:FtsH-binding integral membrane protein